MGNSLFGQVRYQWELRYIVKWRGLLNEMVRYMGTLFYTEVRYMGSI